MNAPGTATSTLRRRMRVLAAALTVALLATWAAPSAGAADATITGPVPTVSGTAKVGKTLVAGAGDWQPTTVKLAYQWYRSGKVIAGATGQKYTLKAADKGARIAVAVTGSAPALTSVTRTSAKTKAVVAGTLTAPRPTITGTVAVTRTLSAHPQIWKPTGVKLTYQWYRSGKAIKGATKQRHKLTASDKGTKITVKVTGTLAGYTKVSRTSAATGAVKKAPPPIKLANRTPPSFTGSAMPGYTLTASPGKWTDPEATFTYRWLRDGRTIENPVYKPRYYVPTFADLGHKVSVRVTARARSAAVTATSRKVTVKPPKAAVRACPASRLTDLAAGSDFALVLTASGAVCGWGENGVGQLGTTTATVAKSRVQVRVPKATQIAAGASHGLALTTSGTVYSWGSNDSGQLGIENPATLLACKCTRINTPVSFVPRKVARLPKITSIAAAGSASVAVAANGTVYAWGNGSTYAKKLAGLSHVTQVATDGERFLARTTSGAVLQWGTWSVGYVQPDGSVSPTGGGWVKFETISSAHARKKLTGTAVKSVALNGGAAYALTTAGDVYGWGEGSRSGQLLPMIPWNGDSAVITKPVRFAALPAAAALYAGGMSAVAKLRDGRVIYWGEPGDQFAHYTGVALPGPNTDQPAVEITSPALNAAAVGFGGMWTGALTTSGTFVNLLSEPLNTYDGYPFRTAAHPRLGPSSAHLAVLEAKKAGCSYGYQLTAKSDVPIVVSLDVNFGTPGYTPSHYEDLEFGGTDTTGWGGGSADCKGTLTLKTKVTTTSAWTWQPDGKTLTKTVRKTWR
ncbi:MAG: hypothetical protein AAGC49_15560 [Brevundimonas sp.]